VAWTGRSGPAVPAQRTAVLLRSGPLHGHQGAYRAPPDAVISLTYAEFLDAVGRLREV